MRYRLFGKRKSSCLQYVTPSGALLLLFLVCSAASTQSLLSQFHTGPDGLPGNDDAGQMSAWYVLSAMGFYPECPGTPSYTIGSPLFTRIVIHQDNGRNFTILASGNSAETIFVRSAKLNGKPLHQLEFSHQDIVTVPLLYCK